MNATLFKNLRMYALSEMSDLLYHILGYGAAFTFHTRHALPIYLNTFAKPNRIPLLLHISAGFIEVFKYQILAMRGTVFPDTWDLILCLYHSLSSIYMTKTLRRGNIGTRPAYQVVALWRLCLSTAAWAKHDPHLHWASVRIINSFVYTRVIIYLAYKARFDRRFSGGDLYAAGVFFAGLISIWEIGLFCGLPLFLAHIAGQMWLIDYISVKFK